MLPRKLHIQRVVPFEGSYGYAFARVTTGWLKASLGKSPFHTYDEVLPIEVSSGS